MRAIPAHRRRSLPSFAAVLLPLSLTAPTQASPLFTAPSLLYPTAGAPVSIAMADLDRDGRLDLVVSSVVDPPTLRGSLSVFLGLGDGTFSPRVDYALAGFGEGVAISDLDRDGRLDVVVLTFVGQPDHAADACILLGNGDGTLRAPTAFAAGNGVRSVSIADLDRDGHLDLVTEQSALLGNGDGTFRPPLVFGTAIDSWAVVADFDGDGIFDVATSNAAADPEERELPSPAAFVRLGIGDGTFGPPSGFGIADHPPSLAAGDMDGDGHEDLVVGCFTQFHTGYETSSSVTVLRGDGDGTFPGQRFFRTGSSPYAVIVADLDADGSPDIATANFDGDPDFNANSITVLLANGDGSYRHEQELPGGEQPRAIAVGDLDGDRYPDLVALNELSNTLSVMLGNGDGTFGARQYRTTRSAIDPLLVDLDGDGELDIVAVSGDRTSTIATMLGKGDGTFGPSADFGNWGQRIFASVGDVNADGRPDVAVASEGQQIVSTLLGNGDGTLGGQVDHTTGVAPKGVEIADLNADGFAELIVANALPGTLSVFPGVGPGTFGAAVDYVTGRFPQVLAKSDLNRDGHWDFVVGDAGSATVSVFLGLADGTLRARLELPTRDAPRSAAVADFDADGDLDLVVVDRPSVHLHRGHGDGTFAPGVSVAPHEDAYDVACADFDADGKLDLAITYPYIRTVSVLLGHGDLTFEPAIDFGANAWGVSAADVNHDGRTDILVAGGAITVMLNLTAPAPIPPVAQPSLLALRIPSVSHATGSRLVLEVSLPESGPATLQMLDLAGRVLASWRFNAPGPGQRQLSLDAHSALTPGMYFLRLTQAGRIANARTAVLR